MLNEINKQMFSSVIKLITEKEIWLHFTISLATVVLICCIQIHYVFSIFYHFDIC